MKRTRDDIESDILRVVRDRGKAGVTAIVYGANLNFDIVKKHLARLIGRNLLYCEEIDSRKFYSVTPTTDRFVEVLATLRAI